MSAVVLRAYRYALDPTPKQVRNLYRHAGGARFAFNWALAAVKANLAQREAERSYGFDGDDLTPVLAWTLPALRRAWNTAKVQVAPWWPECSKEAFNTGLDGVAHALRDFHLSRSGNRAGRRVGFPRFRTRRMNTPAVRFTTGAIRADADRRHVTLPRLGRIKTHESTRKLVCRVEAGTARIISATVRCACGRWYCSFTVEIARNERQPVRSNKTVGVDLGMANLAVLSTGRVVPNQRHLDRALAKLRSATRTLSPRRGPDRRSGRRSSRRWERARRTVSRLHARVANLRRDGLHKLTTEYGTVVVEDLNVAGMLRDRRLARHLADAGFAELRRQLDYKIRWRGGRLLVADRWFASSKTCSACQTVKPKLSLAERTFTCQSCGLSLDRDLNAARNLEQYVARSGRETRNGRGADHKTETVSADGYEAFTPQRSGA